MDQAHVSTAVFFSGGIVVYVERGVQFCNESRYYGLAGIPTEVQRLIYSGRQLENEQTLAHYDVERGELATLRFVPMH